MSDDLLNKYKAYYSVRAEKFAGNPKYSNSYQAEKTLCDAFQSCNELSEVKSKVGDLNEKCAIALVKDESLIEKDYYTRHQETVRVRASERILEKADSCATALDIAQMVTEETNKTNVEISMDEAHRQFQSDWDYLDEYIIYSNAVVPDKYKEQMQQSAADIKDSLIKGVEMTEKNNHEWQAGWRLIPEINLEYRHRRLLPYKDEHVNEKLILYKSIVNR